MSDSNNPKMSRRDLLKTVAGAAAVGAAGLSIPLTPAQAQEQLHDTPPASQGTETRLPSEYPPGWGVIFSPTDPLPPNYQFGRMTTTLKAGSTTYAGSRPLACDIIRERDVPVTLRDGTVISVSIFRPAGSPNNVPAILVWAGAREPMSRSPFNVPPNWSSGWGSSEGADAGFWCCHGYAIVNADVRGSGKSQGNIQYFGRVDAADGHDVVEWVARQPWSNGKVGMFGASWSAMAQWNIAATNPPHLTAIAPWNGISDFYRNTVGPCAVPNIAFWENLSGHSRGVNNYKENVGAMYKKDPLMTPYWEDKAVKLEKINVPAYVGADVTTTLHRMGAFEGFRRISSKEKWLRADNTNEWLDEYDPAYEEDLLRFFDRFLKGIDNGWEKTPKVRMAILDPAAGGKELDRVNVPFSDWPIPETEYQKFYLDVPTPATSPGPIAYGSGPNTLLGGPQASSGTLSLNPPTKTSTAGYDGSAPPRWGPVPASPPDQATFTITFTKDTQVIGYPKLRLWVEAKGADDMDVYALVVKLDDQGYIIDPAPYARAWYDPSPPGTPGQVRVSLRELDPKLSTDFLPVYSYRRHEYLTPGQIVQVDISLLPMSELWHAGEQLRLIVAGHILEVVPSFHSPAFVPGSAPTVNKGAHIIHTGSQYQSYLQLPIVPIGEKSR